ncbi:MAG: DUF2019 domain-containing protein [Methylocella sp.]
MKPVGLEKLTVDQLVERFAEIGIAQDTAELMGEIGKFNKLYREMKEVDTELRARGEGARRALLRLYSRPNMQVRLQAAKKTLAVAPDAARRVIEEIKKSQWFFQAGEAGMTPRNLDSGIFKPD